MRTVVLALSIFVAAQEMPAATRACSRGEPLRMVAGYPIVRTFLNGRGPFQMLVDTGAARCVVRTSVAANAGLLPDHPALLTSMVGEKMVPVAHALIRVGSVDVLASDVLINDLPALDRLESRVGGLLGQNFLAQRPYLIDYRAKRLWLGDEAVEKAQTFEPPRLIEFSFGRPVLPVSIDEKGRPMRLILDSGVNHLVVLCGAKCGALMDEHTIQAVTNAGEMAVRKGRLPIAIVGSERFYGREVVLIDKFSDAAEGAVPLAWFSAVYVDTAQRLIRWTR